VGRRLKLLRDRLAADGLAGFVVPRADEHQGEYVPLCGQRLAWLTGFTGSAGVAVVLKQRAAIFVDGRYTIEARAQIDPSVFAIEHLVEHPPQEWLAKNLKSGMALGYDPARTTTDCVDRLKKACETAGAKLYPADSNPVDAIWTERPAPALSPRFMPRLKPVGL